MTTNKLDELCHRVYITKDFQIDLARIRGRFDIPDTGFAGAKAYDTWYAKSTDRQNRDFYEDCTDMVTKYRLPPDAQLRLKDYILFGTSNLRPESLDVWVPLEELNGVCEVELSHKSTEQWAKSGIPFTRLIISGDATQRDVLKYVRSHWKIIQNVLDVQRGTEKKRLIRPVRDRKMQEEILELNKLSIQELRKMAPPGEYEYKDMAIAAILNSRHQKTITSDNVRKIVTRRSKAKGH